MASHLGKDALSALDIQGKGDSSDEARAEQLIAPALNKGQHRGDAVFRFNRVKCNPEVTGYRDEIGRSGLL